LGQLQNKAASAALSNILRDVNEHPMVRHEAAEALGSIAGIASKTKYYGIMRPLLQLVIYGNLALWCQLCIQTKKRNAIILRSVWNS
jgi:hypothetical protein